MAAADPAADRMMLSAELVRDSLSLGSRLFCADWTIHILDRLEILGVAGDFCECGVWRGAQPILAKAYVERAGYRPRRFWCFDTFAGMPPPGPEDCNYRGHRPDNKPKDWLAIPRAQVEHNFAARGLLDDDVIFVEGMVERTLREELLPETIGYLRLDTDFYSSTKVALEVLYPRLESGGALVIDDYGWWTGAKQATDEYFGDPPPMVEIDRSARLIWKA